MGQAKKRGDFETRKQAALTRKVDAAQQIQVLQLRTQDVQVNNERVRIVSADSQESDSRTMAAFAAAMKAGHFTL